MDDFIPTRGSITKPTSSINFQSVSYESYKRKQTGKTQNSKNSNLNEAPLDEFNIKKAKYEVIKFGMSGFDSQKKEEAKIQLAIKLGAKPPKNKYKNYKQLKEERAKQAKEAKEKSQFQQIGKNAVGKSIAKKKGFDRKRRKTNSGILDVYGKVKAVTKS